jgi:class 3 adenylate cyclase/predicted ATPase
MDVAAWLCGLGLEQYAPAFLNNAIDGETLRDLTAGDLKDLGVALVGHRRRLLAAIAVLRAEPASGDAARPTADSRSAPAAASSGGGAERRQLTVMFCDLVGSTALSSRLDPEDLREVIAVYHHTVTSVVAGLGGFVAKYMGDGVLIYFGYPQAHEDDAERAVRAGLDLTDAVARLDVKSVKLQARVGIATGVVVVGDLIGEGSAREQLVVGETPNLAARLQAVAPADAVVIAAATRMLVGDLFECRDLGAVEIKGIAQPASAWRVLRPTALASRSEALHGSSLSRLVGRDDELDLLMRHWAQAKAGDSQVVLVTGEAGVGKTRLAIALEEHIQNEPHFRQRYFCSPYRQDSALFPFVDQMARAARLAPTDPPAVKLAKLEAFLARGASSDEEIALLTDLMSMPSAPRRPLPNLGPQRKKERTLEALISRLESLARRRPVMIVFEDVHWIDPTSRELLDLAVKRVRNLPVLLVVTFRPEFQPPWTGEPHVTMLVLDRLDQRNRTALVTQIVGDQALPDDVVAQIVARTDGVPLFIEELTKSVLESGLLREEDGHYLREGALPPLAIPASLHALLLARLDRLGSVRQVAQIGAAFGRWFRYTSLRAVAGLPEDDLQASLARLVASGLVFRSGNLPNAIYTFKHALVQEAAYGSLLRDTRRRLHGRIAEVLEAQLPELADSQPEFLARHHAEAGAVDRAVFYWAKAARRSVARTAMAEAAAQFHKALDQLALLPDDSARRRQELEFRSSLATVLQSAKGYAAPETGQTLARATELQGQLGSPSEYLHVSYAQSLYHAIRGELDLAHRFDKDLLHLSRERNDAAGLVLAHQSRGRNLMFAGEFVASRFHLEEAFSLCRSSSQHSLVRQAGVHPQVASQAFLAIVLFCLGHVAQARARATAAIAEARRLAHPPSLAVSLTNGARLLSFTENESPFAEWADELAAMATEQGFLLWRAAGMIFGGWLRVRQGHAAEGISLLRKGSADYSATGAQAWLPYQIALLAQAHESAGQIAEAVDLLDDSVRVAERTGERWLLAELFRHKGRLLLRQGQSDVAEELYRKALSIAEEQRARLWQLRAATGLAQMRRDQGHRTEARQLLAPIYGWFTEGFDTADLREAKKVLDGLA